MKRILAAMFYGFYMPVHGRTRAGGDRPLPDARPRSLPSARGWLHKLRALIWDKEWDVQSPPTQGPHGYSPDRKNPHIRRPL